MTGHMNRSDEEVLALCCAGRNTADIARLLGWPECDVANRLPRILEQREDVAAYRLRHQTTVQDGIAKLEAIAFEKREGALRDVMLQDKAARRHTSNL